MILQVVDAADNVLWDLASWPSVNAEGVVTAVSPSIDLAMPATEYNYFDYSSRSGGISTKTRDPLVDSLFSIHARAADGNATTLQAAVGKLAKIVSKPCIFKWQPPNTTTVRYIDSAGGTVDALASASNDAAYREAHAIEYGVHITRQPYLRGAEVTLGPYTIPNNLASTDGRVKVVTITGDAPAPIDLSVTMTNLRHLYVAALSNPLRDLTAYASTRKYLQFESLTNGADTASAADVNASGGNVKATTYIGAALAVRVGPDSITTDLDALTGPVDVWARVRGTASGIQELQMRWWYGTAAVNDNQKFSEAIVTHTVASVPAATDFSMVYLGRIRVPETNADALRLEFLSGRTSGTAALHWDYLTFVPVESISTFTSSKTTLASEGFRVSDDGESYHASSTGTIGRVLSVAGKAPLVLSPGQNGLYFMFEREPTNGTTPRYLDTLTDSATVTVRYSPRYYH